MISNQSVIVAALPTMSGIYRQFGTRPPGSVYPLQVILAILGLPEDDYHLVRWDDDPHDVPQEHPFFAGSDARVLHVTSST